MRNPILATSSPAARSRQRGVGLIEILVAVLVVSIGFLGMAALLARSLTNNNSAMARTQTVVAAYSILDAMRADRTNALAGSYDTTATYSLSASGNPKCTLSPALAGLADTQVQRWCLGTGGISPDGLAALGPGAAGTIACTANGDCTVTITFDDSRGTAGSANETLTTKGML